MQTGENIHNPESLIPKMPSSEVVHPKFKPQILDLDA